MSKSFPVFYKCYDKCAISQPTEVLADLEMEVLGDLEGAGVTIEQLVEIVNTTTVVCLMS